MKRPLSVLTLLVTLLGVTRFALADTEPAQWPVVFRWELVPKWIAWDAATDSANVSWPPNDGCAAPPAKQTIEPGQEIDRFGSPLGNYFSPKGEAYPARAVPYVCKQLPYTVYRVEKPLAVETCKAAPWFGEPGGATQYKTSRPETAEELVKIGALKVVSYEAVGSSGPSPQCGRP